LGALEARGYKFFGVDEGIKVTRGSMTILKGDRTINLCKFTKSIIIGDTSAATEKEDSTRLWQSVQVHTKGVLYHVSNIANLIFANFALWVDNVE